MTPEGNLMRRIMLRLSSLRNVVTWRNNAGMAWMGEVIRNDPAKGIVVLRNPRPVSFGLTPGASDLIGYTTVRITPEMVGRTVAVFTALEIKTPEGRISSAQRRFVDAVQNSGGIGAVVRSEEEAVEKVGKFGGW